MAQDLLFISNTHEKSYYEKLKKSGYRMFTIRRFVITLALVKIPGETSTENAIKKYIRE